MGIPTILFYTTLVERIVRLWERISKRKEKDKDEKNPDGSDRYSCSD